MAYSYVDTETLKDLTYSRDSQIPENKYAKVRGRARCWLKIIKDPSCSACGYDKHVQVCHKLPVSKFPETALIKEINDPSNIMLLCPNCHWESDNGILDTSSYSIAHLVSWKDLEPKLKAYYMKSTCQECGRPCSNKYLRCIRCRQKGIGKSPPKGLPKCKGCGKTLRNHINIRCSKCDGIYRRKEFDVDAATLLIQKLGWSKAAKEYDISDNALRGRFRRRGLDPKSIKIPFRRS